MEPSDQDFQAKYQRINLKTTDGSTLNGKVNISGSERVSDLFRTGADPFLVMVDVTTGQGSGRTLFINKHHVVWVEPEEA
ncbi:MAG: hypothetical protein A2289_02205 [Deltaproteobacteria bacterium RIFOXYA12_FULL_58_15]|nr:MAG: hypothetical protein A2289_02205 [Deltaproteobacteria bacterium RIFOXYA12_FULL_58_15]OGR08658.1 MAG: hypothetical protein A2341_00935 [Deltaproteobacteria bacterium RIFOXYB12_FULL_58_9]